MPLDDELDPHVVLLRTRRPIAAGSVFVPCSRCRQAALWFVAGRAETARRAKEPPLCDGCRRRSGRRPQRP